MTSVRGLEKFIELQDKIIELLNQEAQDLRKRFLSIKSMFNVFCGIIFWLYIIIILVLSFVSMGVVIVFVEMIFSFWDASFLKQTFIMVCRAVFFFLILWLSLKVLAFLSNILVLKNEEYRYIRFCLGLLVVVPFFVFSLVILFVFLINIIIENDIGVLDAVGFFVEMIFLSFSLSFGFSFVMFFVLNFTPKGFFVILTSGKLEIIKSSHDSIVVRILEKTQHHMSKWRREDFENIESIAENKKVNLTSQLQSITIVLTTITLSGILISFVPSELRETLFTLLDSLLTQVVLGFTGVEGSFEGVAAVIFRAVAFIILGFIVCIAYYYFLESYKVLRAIEIIQLICHSEITKAQQQESSVLRNISMKARLLARLLLDSDISSKP